MNSDSRNSNTQALIQQVKSCLHPNSNNNLKEISISTNGIQSSGIKPSTSSFVELDRNINDDIRSLLSDLVIEIDKKSAKISLPMLVEFEHTNKYYKVYIVDQFLHHHHLLRHHRRHSLPVSYHP